MIILNAILFAVLRAWLGAGTDAKPKLARWVFYAATLGFAYWNTFSLLETASYAVIIITTLGLATGPALLIGINGDKASIWKGFVRNLPILPALWFLNNWWGIVLLAQGLCYFLCGKQKMFPPTRLAEFISGFFVGLIMP